ncbi:MAG: hypothetical protein ABII07_00380 [Patescibacteria group bacterium]|nr:hypothetical protein [Patescibacteria group bacterium]
MSTEKPNKDDLIDEVEEFLDDATTRTEESADLTSPLPGDSWDEIDAMLTEIEEMQADLPREMAETRRRTEEASALMRSHRDPAGSGMQ